MKNIYINIPSPHDEDAGPRQCRLAIRRERWSRSTAVRHRLPPAAWKRGTGSLSWLGEKQRGNPWSRDGPASPLRGASPMHVTAPVARSR